MSDQRDTKRELWGVGPWLDEPDRLAWADPTGLPCIVRRGPMGAWCGYVAVPSGHPLHGRGFLDDGVEALRVHGGITYGEACKGDTKTGICHVPRPGEPDDVWWLGFDCGHFGDLVPQLAATYAPLGDTYRDLSYVRAETTHLAQQLAALALTDGRRA